MIRITVFDHFKDYTGPYCGFYFTHSVCVVDPLTVTYFERAKRRLLMMIPSAKIEDIDQETPLSIVNTNATVADGPPPPIEASPPKLRIPVDDGDDEDGDDEDDDEDDVLQDLGISQAIQKNLKNGDDDPEFDALPEADVNTKKRRRK